MPKKYRQGAMIEQVNKVSLYKSSQVWGFDNEKKIFYDAIVHRDFLSDKLDHEIQA
jgi:hypothetical protein